MGRTLPKRDFAIADTHFRHERILEFKRDNGAPQRPWKTIHEHDEALIERWNEVVRPHDRVYHLGDFCLPKSAAHIAQRLHGEIHLIMGNHEHGPTEHYMQYFKRLYGSHHYKGRVLMTHIPVHPSEMDRWTINMHGHLHDKVIDDPRYICVSAERLDYRPVQIEEILDTQPTKMA